LLYQLLGVVPSAKTIRGMTSERDLLKDAKSCHELADICAGRLNLHATA
jgi:hypothetical protein